MSHTQGEWIVRRYSDGEIAIGTRPESGFRRICSIERQKAIHETNANAALVTAADTLLKACETVDGMVIGEPMDEKTLNQIKNAITKAKATEPESE